MNDYVNNIKKNILKDINSLYHIEKIEKILYESLEDIILFYYMMLTYKNGYVKDLIYFDEKIAKIKFKASNFYISDEYENAFSIWNEIINIEIRDILKKGNSINRLLDKNKGRITFLNKPDIKESIKLANNNNEKLGYIGEARIYTELLNFYYPDYNEIIFGNYDVRILDVDNNIISDEHKYQSDFIIVTNYAVFVIETKNWSGKVKVDSLGNCIVNNEEYRGNPFTQNDRHVADINKFLKEKFELETSIFPLVVFCEKAHVVEVDEKYKDKLVNFDDLHAFIANKIEECRNNKKIDAKIISSFLDIYKYKTYPYYKQLNNGLINEQRNYLKQKNKLLVKTEEISNDTIYTYKDKYKLYNNPSIHFNVQFDNKKQGFEFRGILAKDKSCEHKYSRYFALIYNYLIRNNSIDTKRMIPTYLINAARYSSENIDIREIYNQVYKLMLIMLLMIKSNISMDIANPQVTLRFNYREKNADVILDLALGCLNDYLLRLSMLTFNEPKIEIKCVKTNDIIVGNQDYSDIYICDSLFDSNKGNEIWIENVIQYNIDDSNKDDLLYFAKELSNFDLFRDGQLECLSNILNNPKDKIIIMPTGSGKSFIYYLAAFLQPKITIIISPTDLLIKNQINNLNEIHLLNNLHFISNSFIDINEFKQKQILYMTPDALQNDEFIQQLLDFDTTNAIYSFVLDEVHCLSYRSHNFRPEYLTLSVKLREFFSSSLFLGFTATSDYSVTKELMTQFSIDEDNILSPLTIKTDRIKYDFLECLSENEMIDKLAKIVSKHSKEKTIIFVKSDEIGKKLWNFLDSTTTLLFDRNDYSSLELFSDNDSGFYCLIATIDLGIGIDIKNIKNTIHFGVPFSKMDFSQQVGRAGREGKYCYSYVLYLAKAVIDKSLIFRNNDYKSFFKRVEYSTPNDLIDTYRVLFNKFYDLDKNKEVFDYLVANVIQNNEKGLRTCIIDKLENEMPLFVLYKLGIISYWGEYKNKLKVCISNKIDISNVKNKFRVFLKEIANNSLNSHITLINSISQLASIFYDTFIENYIRAKRDQLFDMFDMLDKYSSEHNISNQVNAELTSFFALPFVSLLNIEEEILGLPFDKINKMILDNSFTNQKMMQIERLYNSNPKFNYIRLINKLNDRNIIEIFADRFSQIINDLDKKDAIDLTIDFASVIKNIISSQKIINQIIVQTIFIFAKRYNCDELLKLIEVYSSITNDEETNIYLMSLYFNKYFALMKGEVRSE